MQTIRIQAMKAMLRMRGIQGVAQQLQHWPNGPLTPHDPLHRKGETDRNRAQARPKGMS
ncbi:MAG: hypothetical protein AAF496_08110 [Pseudomonadota bacterium]